MGLGGGAPGKDDAVDDDARQGAAEAGGRSAHQAAPNRSNAPTRPAPATLPMRIHERVAVASVPTSGGGRAIVERHGRVLARQATPAAELVQVAGGAPAGAPATVVAKPVLDALAVAAAFPAELKAKA